MTAMKSGARVKVLAPLVFFISLAILAGAAAIVIRASTSDTPQQTKLYLTPGQLREMGFEVDTSQDAPAPPDSVRDGYNVEVLEVRNTRGGNVEVDPRALTGKFVAGMFRYGCPERNGKPECTTTLYLVSGDPPEAGVVAPAIKGGQQ
ncbi:TPA: DUF3438 family protein [Salmonella enterica subsp. enterica serovar Muenchen]|nr:DUF3438 family protein [Salmonella enterica subsp. enterica serovar Muenchen]ECG0447031.1 DUF3438 family protein [Salmonella enterica]ECJ4482653.1 hypothetical protein [Salmonella enterica subsp. diarizonae]EBY3556127.1 DUF3438 family protein [Salmonella enterica subsp. enterica serovar Muenchen]ECZ0254650.1 DUF3438 family protein [Salmonella enterica subsp. diarizonae]